MDPTDYHLIQPFLTFAYNELLQRLDLEHRFTISHVPNSAGLDPTHELFDSFHHSVESSAVILAPAGVTELDLYDAFRLYTAQSTVEYALVATTESARSKVVAQFAVSRGEQHGVEIPKCGLRMIAARRAQGDSFGTRFLHNHPPSFMHSLFQLAQLGPSSTDRSAFMQEVARGLRANNQAVPQFVLIEGDEFAQFKFPPWETVVGVLCSIWNLWQSLDRSRRGT